MSAGKMGKMVPIRVQMLDDSITLFQVQMKSPGRILFDQVCKQLNLLEVDYFGLEYHDNNGISYWLDIEKPITHQVCLNRSSEPLVRFCVKFYTPDLTNIEEEYTRYLFSLQIKRDLSIGQLQCNDNTAALLASYIVQAECGDYVVEDYPDHTYLSTYKFVPHQDADLESKIMENHKRHIGILPGEADLNLLETARRCELYGMKMHPAKDHEGVCLNLSVAHMGVVVFQNLTKINTFSWAKIRKLSFKRKKYLIKLHPEGYGYYKDTVEFYFEDRNHCKNFWKKCVEHHSFFRCQAVSNREREKHKLISKGSSFRYSGKTQKQMQEFVRENFVKRQSFQRQSRQNAGVGGGLVCTNVTSVGQSLSAQPLLPIEENPTRSLALKYNRASGGRLMSESHSRSSATRCEPFLPSSANFYNHHSLPHQSSQFRNGGKHPSQISSFQTTSPFSKNQAIQGDLPASHTTPSSPFHGARSQIQFSNSQDTEMEDQQGMPRQGYRHSIHGGDIFSSAIVEGSLTAGGNNTSEVTVIENRQSGGQNPASLNHSRTSVNSGNSGYHIVVQGLSGPVAHDVHSDHEFEGEDDECQVSSEDNLSHDSYELIEWEGENDHDHEHDRDREATLNKDNIKIHPCPPPQGIAIDKPVQPPISGSTTFPRMKSNDSFSQESDHNVSIMNLNKLSRINHLLTENSSLTNPTPSFTSDTDEFQGHEVTLQRPPQTPEERLIVDIVRKRGLQMNINHKTNNLTNSCTRSLPRFLPGRDRDLVLGPPPTAYPFGRKHVYSYASRTLPNRQRREKSPRVGLTPPGGPCSSGSSSSQASPKISRPKSLEFAAMGPSAPGYFYQDNRQHRLLDYDDSSISGVCAAGPGGVVVGQPAQYATSSSDVPQTPENSSLPHLPMDKMSAYKRVYREERIYDVPEGIEPADITSPSSSSGVTDSFPRPSPCLTYNYMFRNQEPRPPPLPREAPPPLPIHSSTMPATGSSPQVHQSKPGGHVEVGSFLHHKPYVQPRVKIQEPPVVQKSQVSLKPVHMLFSMSSTESESALSARSAPTPVLGILDEKSQNLLDISTAHHLLENDDSELQQISVNLISPPEESESSTAVLNSEERIPAPPPEFSGAAAPSANDADMQEATDVEDEEANEEELSTPSQKQVAEMEETCTVSQESKLTVITNRVDIAKVGDTDPFQDGGAESKGAKFYQGQDMIEEEEILGLSDQEDIIDDDETSLKHISDYHQQSIEIPEILADKVKFQEDMKHSNNYFQNHALEMEEGCNSIHTSLIADITNCADMNNPGANKLLQEGAGRSKGAKFYQGQDMIEEEEILGLSDQEDVIDEDETSLKHLTNYHQQSTETPEILAEKIKYQEEMKQKQKMVFNNFVVDYDFEQDIEEEDEEDENVICEEFLQAEDDYNEDLPASVNEEASQMDPKSEKTNGEQDDVTVKPAKSAELAENDKSLSNGEEESEVIKIGEMYVRLDNGSTLSDHGSEEDDNVASLNQVDPIDSEEVAASTMPVVTQESQDILSEPEKIEVPPPLPCMERLPSLPTGDSASSLGLDQIPPPPPLLEDVLSYADEDSYTPPPQESPLPDPVPPVEVTPRVTFLPSPPSPEVPQPYYVPLPIRALSRISECSTSEGPQVLLEPQPQTPQGSRSATPPSEASKGPAEDTMSEKNYTSSEDNDNDNPPSLCSDLPENGVARGEEAVCSVYNDNDIVFPSPPSSLLEGSATILEPKTEFTHIEPDSLYLELSPPGDGEEEGALGGTSDGQPGSSAARPKEKIPYHFSISSENEVTNKEDEDSQNSLHESMEILEERNNRFPEEFEKPRIIGSSSGDETKISNMGYSETLSSPTSAASYTVNDNLPYQSVISNSLTNYMKHHHQQHDIAVNSLLRNNSINSQYLTGGSDSNPAGTPLRLLREESIDANGTLSPMSTRSNGTDTETDLDSKKKRNPSDKAYFIAKEILMTERTYKKDLEILNLWFRDEVSKEEELPEDVLTLLFSYLDPIYELHCSFLRDIEQRMASWESRGNSAGGNDVRRIGDVILRNFDTVTTEYYMKYVDAHNLILEKLEDALNKNARFSQIYREFEEQKVCYLPVTTLLLKPMHRILHYELLLDRLLKHIPTSHADYHSTNMALVKMQSVIRKMSVKLRESENYVKLAELQRDLGGSDEIIHPDREFLREGCLQKLSRKGYQQRMFFLFSDMILYANRSTTPKLHFRVHGQMSLKDLSVLDSEPRLGAEFCFNLYDGKKAVLLSATSLQEKIQWMEDIAEAAQIAKERSGSSPEPPMPKFTSLKSMSGSEDGLDRTALPNSSSAESQQQRAHSSVHVCWHRSTTVPVSDYHKSLRTMLSGYLLRKFKSSNGWQKLWVVFAHSCLYFYKTFQDDFPLASLPLLGYDVRRPDPDADEIHKDFVFKLTFKNHVYFFRAESQFTYDRWIEVLGGVANQQSDIDPQNGN